MKYRKCPEHCNFRSPLAPFCGFCMVEILEGRREEREQRTEQETAEDVEVSGVRWDRYREKTAGADAGGNSGPGGDHDG